MSSRIIDASTNSIFFRADITQNISFKSAVRKLPPEFVADEKFGPRAIRSTAHVISRRPSRLSQTTIAAIVEMNRVLRRELFFINGAEALWYIKSATSGPARIQRQLPTLILGAMHRLSEISRYHPLQMASLLAGQKNWLLSEFIQMSADQFIDEIASELTGHQFLVPNIRAAV